MNEKRYLVTGGAGFIGANFVKYILGKYGSGVRVMVLDALTYAGNLLTISDEIDSGKIEFVKGDIGDADLVARLLKEFDPHYVVNFAAESHVDRSIENPRLFLETNILGTQNLLDQCRKAWRTDNGYREGHKYLQISTDEVYGSLTKDYDEAQPLELTVAVASVARGRNNLKSYGNGFFTETTPLAPRSPYSAAKTGADLITLAYYETYGLPINITRCSNNYGPYHFPEKLIPLLVKNILEGKHLPVYGKGENVRDWLYVEDHCKAIDMVLRNGRVGEVYNIGGFNESANIDIVRTVIATVRRMLTENEVYRKDAALSPEQIDDTLIDYVTDRPGHDMRYAIDPTKIATELGWYPETPFETGIEKTVKWFLDNRAWVDSVTSGDYQKYYEKMYSNR